MVTDSCKLTCEAVEGATEYLKLGNGLKGAKKKACKVKVVFEDDVEQVCA